MWVVTEEGWLVGAHAPEFDATERVLRVTGDDEYVGAALLLPGAAPVLFVLVAYELHARLERWDLSLAQPRPRAVHLVDDPDSEALYDLRATPDGTHVALFSTESVVTVFTRDGRREGEFVDSSDFTWGRWALLDPTRAVIVTDDTLSVLDRDGATHARVAIEGVSLKTCVLAEGRTVIVTDLGELDDDDRVRLALFSLVGKKLAPVTTLSQWPHGCALLAGDEFVIEDQDALFVHRARDGALVRRQRSELSSVLAIGPTWMLGLDIAQFVVTPRDALDGRAAVRAEFGSLIRLRFAGDDTLATQHVDDVLRWWRASTGACLGEFAARASFEDSERLLCAADGGVTMVTYIVRDDQPRAIRATSITDGAPSERWRVEVPPRCGEQRLWAASAQADAFFFASDAQNDAQRDAPRVPKLLVRDGSLTRTVNLELPARPARAAHFVDRSTLDVVFQRVASRVVFDEDGAIRAQRALFHDVEDDPQFGGGLLWDRVDDDDHRFARARDMRSGAEVGRFAVDAIDDRDDEPYRSDERTLWVSELGLCAVISQDKRELFVLSPKATLLVRITLDAIDPAGAALDTLECVAFASDHRAVAVGTARGLTHLLALTVPERDRSR
jgi:hypothetical protein